MMIDFLNKEIFGIIKRNPRDQLNDILLLSKIPKTMAKTLDPISGNQVPKQMEIAAIANDRAIPGRFFFTS